MMWATEAMLEQAAAAKKELMAAAGRVASKQLAALGELVEEMRRICPKEGHAVVKAANELRDAFYRAMNTCDHSGEPVVNYTLKMVASGQELIEAGKVYEAAMGAMKRKDPGVQ